jgi:hypothetical protein
VTLRYNSLRRMGRAGELIYKGTRARLKDPITVASVPADACLGEATERFCWRGSSLRSSALSGEVMADWSIIGPAAYELSMKFGSKLVLSAPANVGRWMVA